MAAAEETTGCGAEGTSLAVRALHLRFRAGPLRKCSLFNAILPMRGLNLQKGT